MSELNVKLPDDIEQVQLIKIKPGETVRGITNLGDEDEYVEFEVDGQSTNLPDAIEDCHANIESALNKLTKPGVFLK